MSLITTSYIDEICIVTGEMWLHHRTIKCSFYISLKNITCASLQEQLWNPKSSIFLLEEN